uniref:Dystonin n=1 Tax=Cyprinus carpio TaxID=7962 RepID=A0A8C1IVI2_CYPCA
QHQLPTWVKLFFHNFFPFTLFQVRKHVNDLYEDLRDGHNLISLLEVLSGETLPREKGRMRFHRLQNVQIALDYLKRRQVKLVNIRNDDITDGNPKLTLGLIWTIILHFQISDVHVTGESEDMTAKERLLLWSQQMTEGYVGVRCDNFTTSWRDGRLFNAIIHKYRPDLVDMSKVSTQSSRSNLEQAFGVAEQLGVARLLDPEDVDVSSPDEKSVITYVSTLYDVFPKVPEGMEGISANDVDVKWVEYQNMVKYLSQWIKHNVTVMTDRNFPSNPVELKALYTQYLQFKENEIPPKENEKAKIKHLYKMLEAWIEFGRIQLPQGYHPNDVEKEWGKLIVAMLEREKSLRPEVDRYEMIYTRYLSIPLKQSYSEKLNKLESQYRRLLKCSSERQKHLDSLYDFVSRATQELIWLNEKEEEEVAFDWSERNSNISRKRDYHADLMRELDDKEEVIKSVQEKAESLLLENHPARLTIEAYRAAMQTQWSWILQLCHCVEQHLKENAVYFDFFSEAKESLDYLKSLQDAIHRKYSCDRSSSLHRLEDLIQESMDEKEQLLKYSSTVGGLVGRAKSVVQLKARNPENPIRTSIPIKAICDYRQIEITISKEDECVLVSNSHRAKWKVISPSGNEAMVPSVCFSVPPPNKEATEMASRIEQLYQNVLALWHHSHINMKSVVSWHYLMTDIRIKTLLPGDHEQVLSSLQSHFEDFLRDSDESEVFTVADCAQLEKEVLACKEYYEELLKSAEREEQEESMYNLFISEVRNFRMRVEGHEEQLIRKIRTPLDRDDLQECVLRITEQEKKKVELDRLKDDLESLREKCEVFLRQAAASPSVPSLSSELNILTQSTNQVYSMCCIYLEKLKTVSLVVKHSQSAEALVKLYEAKLCEEDTINANIKSIDGVMSTLKQWRSEIDERREVFHDLEDELQKARVVSERMFKTHNERDFDLDWHKEKADQLKERWQNIHSQIENRSLSISKSLKYYIDTYNSLDEWITEMEAKQLKAQENQPEDSKALAEFLNQQKVLVTEIEQKQSKIEECQKYSEQYAVGVKDYELQLMTYRAMVDSQHKSPMKRRKMQSSSDVIQQEFMDLRTRYTALVTLMTQYVKFAGEKLKRVEEDEESCLKLEHERKLKESLHTVETAERDKKHLSQEVEKLKTLTSNATKAKQEAEEQLCNVRTQLDESVRQRGILDLELLKAKSKISELETEKIRVKSSIFQLDNIHKDRLLDEGFARQLQNILISLISLQALKVIQGILDVESGAVMSVCYSVNNGFIDQNTGLGLLEAQLITTGLIWPEQHLHMDLEEAFKHKLVDDTVRKQLQELNETKKCLQDLQFALEPLPVMAALEKGAISEQTAMKIIEIQLATGGLRLSYTGDILHLEGAFQLGLIPQSLFIQILERKDTWKNLIDPNTAEKVSLSQLVQRSMMHEPTGLRLLPVKRGKDGTISLTSGREINIMKAMHEGVIDRETMFRLLSTQLFAGGIADAKTGRKLTVAEALSEGLIDQDTASEILSHQAQNGGIVNPCNGARLTVDEAVQCDLISSSSALLVLERQKAFMGLLWPNAGEILSFSTSLQQNIITDKLASELLQNRHKITALYIPETSEVVDIDSVGVDNLIETFTKELLKTIEIPDVFPDIDELNNRFSSWLVMKELQIDGSCSIGEEISDENSSDAPSPSEAKQLFISYLIMNSYMDPKSGQRLLIFDWQLNKMAKLLFETSEHVDEISGLYMNVSEESLLNPFSIPDDDNACLNSDDGAMGELQICEPLESKTEQEHEVVNSNALKNCLKPTLPSESVVNAVETDHKCDIFLDSAEQMTVIETNNLPKNSTWSYTDKCHSDISDVASPQPSDAMQLPQTAFSIAATASMVANPECHDASKDQEKHLKHSPLLSSETTSYTEMPSEFPHTDVVWDDKLERDYAMHLLRAQVEEGGILDVTSGKRYDLEAALGKGLIDEETVLEVPALQLQEDGLKESENTALSVLNISVSKGCISSKVALQIMEKQNLLGGFYDAAVGRTISICDALETGMITDDISRSVLSSEAIRKSIIDPGGKCVLGVYDANKSGMLDDKEAERMLHSQRNEREDIRVPDLAKRGQISLRSDEATQIFTDIACVSSSQDLLLPTICGMPSKVISAKDDMFGKVSETNEIGEDCDVRCGNFKTMDFKNELDTTDERKGSFTLEGNEIKRPNNSIDTFLVDVSCETVSPSPCISQMACQETTVSHVVNPVQRDSGISCSSQSDICSEERKSERVLNPEQEFNRSKVECETANACFDKGLSESLSTSPPMVEDVGKVTTLEEAQSTSSLYCASAKSPMETPAELDLSTDDQSTLAQNLSNEKVHASYKVENANNVSEDLDHEHSDEDSGVFSSENRVLETIKYEDMSEMFRNTPKIKPEPRVVCTESSIDCKVEENEDIEDSVGFKGSEDTCQLSLIDLAGSTVNSKQLPLEIVTNSSQVDSNGGNHNIQNPSEQGIFCNHVAPKATTKGELARSSESDFTSDDKQVKDVVEMLESSSGKSSEDMFTESNELQSARQIQSPSVKIMLDQNSEQSADIFNQSQAGDTVVAEGVHQDDLHFPHMVMAEDASLPKSMGSSDLKSFLNALIQMKMDGASMDKTQKQKCQAIDSIIEIIQHHSGISPTNHPNSSKRGGDPDILLDLKKHEGPREDQNWPSDESNDQPKHQTDLLEMIQRISTNRDQEMLKEVDGKLSSFLECTALRDESMERMMKMIFSQLSKYGLQIHLETSHQDLLSCLDKVSACIQDSSEMVSKLDFMDADNIERIKKRVQQNKVSCLVHYWKILINLLEIQGFYKVKSTLYLPHQITSSLVKKDLSGTRQLLEDSAFDIQNFISEHAQFLSPTHSRYLLRALSTTQRSYKELMDRVFTQRQTLEVQLEIHEEETQQKKQREFSEKLQELFDDLTQTENRLIGHQQQAASAKTVGDLQQYQQEHQALQKDLQANASALNEVISSTKKFLEENRSKLAPEQISALENKLEELKSKANMLNQRAEESRKDLEKVSKTSQTLFNKTKIEGLLDWISNVGKEKEMGGIQKEIIGEEDDPNGNALDTTDNTTLNPPSPQVHHQEILSQQQDLIIATQSAQALLDKQAQVLSPAEKDKLQRDIKELEGRYKASLTQAEQQMKQVQTVQEELQKFKGDCEEFETWLQQAHGEMEELGAPAAGLDTLSNNLQRQKSFSEDVISHKGDLRFITISGQKVLDAAKACDCSESGGAGGLPVVDMSGTCYVHFFQALEQDMFSRQSSILAMKAKVKTFVESAEPAAAALLQAKMEGLSQRFTDASEQHKQKVAQIEDLRDKVEQFEKTSEKVQQFVLKSSQALSESDGPGKNVAELSQLVQVYYSLTKHHCTVPKPSELHILIGVLWLWFMSISFEVKSLLNHILYLPLELMLVQQNMSYINNNYEHLGELLKARSSELGALLKRVLGVHEQAESLRQWMEDTKKTATSLSNRPSGKDTVKSQIEQQKEVRGTMEVRKQHLEESSRMLELFQTTQPQLSQWLQEKELMMGVLGPLSVDPNMLNTQKQQVQILLKEFDSRKPQYEKLTEAATAIASASEQQDPAVEQVKEQLASVSQKWQALTGQLSQRHALIEQVVGKTTQFQELLRSLSKSATCLETELNNQQALSTQPDEVKKQIEATNSILAQLREEKKRLKEAETVCSELSAMVTEEYLRADLTKQLESTTKPFRQLEDNAGKRIEQLNSAFASSQQFHQTSKDFQAWLNQTLQEQCKPQPISANAEKLKQSLKENSAAQKAISEHGEPYNTIIKEGEALLQSTEGAEKVALQGQLSALKSSWHDVKKGNAEQAEKIQGALERALKYKEHYENLSSWVQEVEDREKNVKLSANSVEIEGSLSQLKAIQKDVEKHRGQVVMMNAAVDSLLEVVTSDGDSVREEKVAIGKRVDKLTEDLTLKRESLENISQKLKEFNDLQKEAKGQLEAARKQLDSHSALGVQAYSNKNLTNMKAQQNSLEGVHNQVEHLKNVAKSLVVDASDVEGVTDLLLQADSLEKDHMSITKKVEDACSTLENKLQGIGQFQNSIREMFANFTDLDDEFDGMAPVDRDLDTLRDQQSTIKDFVARLQDLMTNTANGRDSCKKMLESEASPDLLGLKRDLETLGKQCGKLMDRATGRREQVEETLSHLEEFYSKAQEFSHNLSIAEKQEESQGPVGLETEVINQQLESFKVFHKDVIESLQSQLQELNTLGQALIQNAAKGTNTKKLDHDLEEVNTRWNTLNKKVAERSAQLHEALLHCGRFQDALESLLSWLTDTEELVANQKAPSAEFKVVKAQIQEQKLLQRLLDDRRATVELIKTEGRKVTNLADTVDKEKIAKEIECLGQRQKQLENILVVAQQFHETLEPLTEWLTATEKRLANSEPIGTQTSKIEEQISQHKALHEDIELRKQNIEQAILNGLELLKQTTGDEVVVIQGKLDGIKTRYSEINTMSNNVSKTLDKALSLATKLQNTHEELNSWLEKVESELATFTAQEPVGEQLTHLQERQKTLMKEVKDQKPLVDSLNEVSSALLELVPWRAREGLDRMVTDDNERYKMASDAITQHVDQTGAAILKSQQFEQAATTELEWLTDAERKLSCLGDVRLEPEHTTAQLQAQKVSHVFMWLSQKHTKCYKVHILQTLSEKCNVVSQLNSERCLQLERAHSLACQFWETHDELWPWLQETRTAFTQLSQPAIEYEVLRQQQEELRQMRELIAEHKPHIDKMNKTGPQLVELSPTEGVPIREKYEAAEKLYSQLKVDVKHRAAALDEAISKSTQFHDKIDPMLESLERIAERLRQPPSISVEVEKIREQISENKAVNVDLEKLQPSYETLKQRGEEMIARSEGADKDLSAKAVQDKLDQMVFLWNDIQALLEEREAKLLDVMDLAEKFWCDHCALIVTIKDTHDLLKELEEPGVDPSVVKQQQESVEGFREEIDGLQEELNVVQNLGAELMTACGEPDKPVIKKSIDEVNSAWETLNKAWKERVETLEEAMQAAVQFQDSLQNMFDSVDIMEGKLDLMSPVGTDLETVKQQIEELKVFKADAYQLQIEMERLNHQTGLLLKKVVEEADRTSILEPMNELKILWDSLDKKIINRQHKLEGALLALGQFQHALDELLAWLTHTEELLNEQRKACGDPKAIEIELAKHHVLQNDVLAHKTTVEAVNKAGSDLIDSSAGEEARGLQNKLENLNQRWRTILEKTEQRRQLLDSALLQAQGFHGEIEDMQQWLKDTERQLLPSKALGGLPDTAREQLNTHLELCSTLEAKEEIYKQLLDRGQQILTLTPEGQDSTTELDLRNLQEKWECVQAKVTERKVKLEEALAMATDFHNSLQDFINWLTQAEQTLTMVSPASLILETVMFQIDEHKVFVTEVNSHRDQIIELDKTGTHLKYFSQKQDVVLIKNLLLSVQGRWEKVVQRSVERGRLLDDARKRAKQFHETWNKLMEWLEESERALDSELEIANDPDKIKTQLTQHKEFQKTLGSKHSVYDTTSRTGRALKDKTSLQDDNQKLDDMLSELRDKWDTVCGKSVERQNKLEEALLFSGQFTDALQALIDWLYKVEPQLAEDQPVHGDIDLVLNLIDSHKVFQKELGKRTGSVQALKRSARELIENSHDDSSWVKVQMQELSTRWETVCSLSVSKQTRLEQALCQAEEFHSTVHILLEWLAEAEQSLRFHGALPDDEEALRALIEQHKEFMKKLEEKRLALNKATSMGEAILSICHPDSITTIKHWNTIIKARFEEVTAWVRQHQQRLSSALAELLATQELLENLLNWLQWAETTLGEKDKEPLPQELEEVKSLIAEHQTFMEEMTRKQPDVDKITKTHKRKSTADPPVQSQIPVPEKGRTASEYSIQAESSFSIQFTQIETKNPRVNLLVSKWQQVWLLALDRRRKLNDALDRLEELKEFANFDFDVWRKRYMRWMNHKKSRVMDFFRRIDKDQDGKVTRQEFIDGILSSKFPTSRLEMSAVADIFDRDGDGYIDYYEFVAALHPNKDAYKPLTDADKIEDEVTRQVAKCKCPKRFQVEQIGANKYRFYLGNQFGDSQQLRLVRILRSTVMVRVGGGWMALDEFLVKNDPCRAKGRTNVELREKFILPEGTTQVMASFRYRGRRSRPSSRGASPNRSNSSHSCPTAQPNPPGSNTPKVWILLIRFLIYKGLGKISSRPGSKAGSRGSSRRGSDASDFDISDIQSVCSDVSETVTDSGRPTPRSASRQHGGKPSKIPTPQRRSTPTSKLAKTTKR